MLQNFLTTKEKQLLLVERFPIHPKLFFPVPQKAEVVLHPVNAWKNGKALALSGPILNSTK